jgi:hypothetical protein
MQSYGAVGGDGDKAYGYPAQQAPPYPAGNQQMGVPSAAAQGNYPAPPYPPAGGQPGGVEGPDNFQLPSDGILLELLLKAASKIKRPLQCIIV